MVMIKSLRSTSHNVCDACIYSYNTAIMIIADSLHLEPKTQEFEADQSNARLDLVQPVHQPHE